MGHALLRGWENTTEPLFSNISCVDRKPPEGSSDSSHEGALFFKTLKEAPQSDILLIAIKPQNILDAMQDIQEFISKDTIIWSIAAGIPINQYEAILGPNQPIFRIMPNTPASVQKGTFAACHNTCGTAAIEFTQKSFAALGTFVWLENDREIDIVTALSGGGPAYYFTFTQMMADAAMNLGLPKEKAELLARETLIGSATLLEHSPQKTLEEMVSEVTSPKGTTERAIQFFKRSNLSAIMSRAIEAAFRRGRDLSSENK